MLCRAYSCYFIVKHPKNRNGVAPPCRTICTVFYKPYLILFFQPVMAVQKPLYIAEFPLQHMGSVFGMLSAGKSSKVSGPVDAASGYGRRSAASCAYSAICLFLRSRYVRSRRLRAASASRLDLRWSPPCCYRQFVGDHNWLIPDAIQA